MKPIIETTKERLYEAFYKEYHNRGYGQAIDLLLSIQQIESKPSFWIYSRLSSCYYELKEYEMAVNYGKLAYKINPKSPLVIWDYAGALIMAKNEKRGINLLVMLQSMDDDLTHYGFADADRKWMQSLQSDANFLIGKAYYAICEDDLAKEYLQRYLDLRKKGLRSIFSKKQASYYLEKLK